jgi:hydrogenase maturation protease
VHTCTPHDVNFATAIELGKRLGMALPQQIDIFAIEVVDAVSFGEECTPEISAVVPVCVEMILKELKGDNNA